MASQVVRLADLVTAELGATAFDLPCSVRREYRPRYEPKDLVTVQLTVVPRELNIEPAAASKTWWTCRIDIAVQKKLAADEDIEPLIDLTEQVAEQFTNWRPADMPEAVCMTSTVDPLYADEHLDALHTFTAVVELTFRILK
ncbi:MAG: hypothetical protein D6741_08200 [Planctomycetota bacterium]|nr:MAG: hypothetical protein D6741_08200 [Planctomycetota bacterium]